MADDPDRLHAIKAEIQRLARGHYVRLDFGGHISFLAMAPDEADMFADSVRLLAAQARAMDKAERS